VFFIADKKSLSKNILRLDHVLLKSKLPPPAEFSLKKNPKIKNKIENKIRKIKCFLLKLKT